jgi:hypothetical protein
VNFHGFALLRNDVASVAVERALQALQQAQSQGIIFHGFIHTLRLLERVGGNLKYQYARHAGASVKIPKTVGGGTAEWINSSLAVWSFFSANRKLNESSTAWSLSQPTKCTLRWAATGIQLNTRFRLQRVCCAEALALTM